MSYTKATRARRRGEGENDRRTEGVYRSEEELFLVKMERKQYFPLAVTFS